MIIRHGAGILDKISTSSIDKIISIKIWLIIWTNIINKFYIFSLPPEYEVTHPEALDPGSDVVTVAAVTTSPPVTYTILRDQLASRFFSIEPSSGRIFLRQRFTSDSDNNLIYTMVVTARDTTGSIASTIVKVN